MSMEKISSSSPVPESGVFRGGVQNKIENTSTEEPVYIAKVQKLKANIKRVEAMLARASKMPNNVLEIYKEQLRLYKEQLQNVQSESRHSPFSPQKVEEGTAVQKPTNPNRAQAIVDHLNARISTPQNTKKMTDMLEHLSNRETKSAVPNTRAQEMVEYLNKKDTEKKETLKNFDPKKRGTFSVKDVIDALEVEKKKAARATPTPTVDSIIKDTTETVSLDTETVSEADSVPEVVEKKVEEVTGTRVSGSSEISPKESTQDEVQSSEIDASVANLDSVVDKAPLVVGSAEIHEDEPLDPIPASAAPPTQPPEPPDEPPVGKEKRDEISSEEDTSFQKNFVIVKDSYSRRKPSVTVERGSQYVELKKRLDAVRSELKHLEEAYHGNNAITVAQEFGIETFNQGEARDALERIVKAHEAEIHRLEQEMNPIPVTDTKSELPKVDAADLSVEKEINIPQEPSTPSEDVIENKVQEEVTEVEEAKNAEEKFKETPVINPETSAVKEAELPPVPQQIPDFNIEMPEKKIDPWVTEHLGKQFNIKPEDIASIEGFGYLSAPQQKFICENLAQLTLGNVREEAARTVSEAVGMRKSEMTQNYGKFLGGVLAGTREVFMGGYTKLKTEKAVVARMEKGGIAQHGALLQELVNNIAKYGPRVNERAGGELVVDLVNIRDRASDQKIRKAEFFAISELNAAAYEFTKTPAEWKGRALGTEEWKITNFFKEKVLRTSGKVQESAYEKRAAAYELKKLQLEEVLKQKGYDDTKIAETLIDLDSRVYQLQTLRTSPDAMAELANIKDRSFFAESAKHFFAGPGAYMALGAVGRTLGGAALGFVGAPIASASVAWLRSWNRTAAELRERDRNARAGVVDKKKGALNVVAVEDAERTIMVNGKPMQNGLTAKLERLLEQAEHATGDQKKRLLEQLRLRVEYVHDKQKLQRVNYGKADGRVSRQVALTETLAKSLAYLSAQDMMTEVKPVSRFARTKEKAKGRLDRELQRTERGIIEWRRLGREADVMKSVTVAASFSFVGALAADYFRKDSLFFNESSEATLDTSQSSASTFDKEKSIFSGSFEDSAITAKEGVNKDRIFDGASDGSDSAEVLSLKETAPYTIQRGDTLIGIMREKIPAIRGLGTESTMARENATMNILRDLTPKELQDIGITSGNVNKIYAGDSISIEKLNEAILARKGIIERAITRFGTTPIGGNPIESVASSDPTPIAEVTETTEKTVTLQRATNDLGKLPREIGYKPAVVPESWTSSEAIENRKIKLIERTRSFFASPDAWDRIRTIPVARILGVEGGYPVNDSQLIPVINFFKSIEPSGVRIALPLAPKGYTVERYLNSFADLLARDLTPQEYERFIAGKIERLKEARIGGSTPESIPTAASAEVVSPSSVDPDMPRFKGGFDGELITQETAIETFPITDAAEDTKVGPLAETAGAEARPSVVETPVSGEMIAERKNTFFNAIKDRYASEREWKRTLNLRMQDIARYEGVATTNPESVAGRAQSVFAMRRALESAGFDSTESKNIFERFVNGKLSVGAYLESVSEAVAKEGKSEVYEKLLKAIDPETMRAAAMEQWTKPEMVAERAKDLQNFFTESLRARDRTQWARWAQGWQSPFSNKSELFLESARQHLISQREQFVDLLKKYKIPLAPQGGESQPQSIARFSRLLAEKITPEELKKLDIS